jgi:predicted ArsR family transcriptional regulator
MMDIATQAAGLGALAEPIRRALYEYVVAQPQPVGREAAAVGVGVPAHKAKFHLDRLVDEGLLEVEFRRLGGKTGPGAGRPSKLYRRSEREWSLSLPGRSYDLVGHILADGVERAVQGVSLDDALQAAAVDAGTRIGSDAAGEPLVDVFSTHGYEPRLDEDVIMLANCPFDSLAQRHTELICGLNRSFVQGIADGLGCNDREACLEPEPEQCCVKVRPRERV